LGSKQTAHFFSPWPWQKSPIPGHPQMFILNLFLMIIAYLFSSSSAASKSAISVNRTQSISANLVCVVSVRLPSVVTSCWAVW